MPRRNIGCVFSSLTSKASKQFCRERFAKCKSLYRKDLLGHFGCVNAVEFSNDGRWLVSGGDDRRVLLWDVNKVTRKGHTAPCQMKTEHLSNIFCTIFDNETKHIFSAGNDEDVVRHNIERAEAVGHYTHEEAVYCVALPHDGSNFFASAGECGAVFLWDVRAPEEEQLCLAMSAGSFHGVAFNPYETQLVVTANHYDGVILYDLRKPEVPLIKYGVIGQRESAMFAKFNQLGTQILTLMRRSGPMLYDVENKDAPIHFNHAEYKNICTLKSPCFIGDADEFVAAGSDDFNIYLWRNPGKDLSGKCNEDPLMVLKGHRSIVNQIRYNPYSHTIASSGVEKVIKLWSQFRMEGCHGYITEEENIEKREFYSHEQYMQLIVESGVPLSHDYGLRSVDEDPRMLAFFDSLIQRVNSGWLSDDSSDEETPMEEFLLQLASQISEDSDDLIQNTPNVLDSFRIFRSNRRLLTEESENPDEQDTRGALSRRLRYLLSNENWMSLDTLHSETRVDGASGPQSRVLDVQETNDTNNIPSTNGSLSKSQREDSARQEVSTVVVTTEIASSSSVDRRKISDTDKPDFCHGSSSSAKESENDQKSETSKCACPDDNDDDHNNTFSSEVTPLQSPWEPNAYDCCLRTEKLESKQLCYSHETCSTLNSYDKHSLESQPSTHLCEKTKYVAVKQKLGTEDESLDYGKLLNYDVSNVEASISGEDCSYCNCRANKRTCVDDLEQAKNCKLKKLGDTCPFDNGNVDDEGRNNVSHLSKTMQNTIATCSTMVDTCVSVCAANSSDCSSTLTTNSLIEHEASNGHGSETIMRRRHGYKKRNYRRSSNS